MVSEFDKYYANVESFKDKFNESQNQLYFIPKTKLETRVYSRISFAFSKAVKELKIIGIGSFGKVSLCKVEGILGYCVTKTLKQFVEIDDLKAEIEVLDLASKCKFLTKMFYSGFNSRTFYIIILECIYGGDLLYHYKNSNLNLDAMKVIFNQISRGLEFLHRYHRTHGDLKLANIGLTVKGNVKLFDFGKSRNISTPCILPRITLTYEAPENIQRLKADESIDWWSYGCLVTKMLQKQYPFYHEKDEILELMILNDEPNINNIDDPDAKGLILKLLQKDPANRLKSSLAHKFFDNVNKKVPLFIPGDVVSKLENKTLFKNKDEEEITFGMTLCANELLLDDLLLRYPTKECVRFMKRK